MRREKTVLPHAFVLTSPDGDTISCGHMLCFAIAVCAAVAQKAGWAASVLMSN